MCFSLLNFAIALILQSLSCFQHEKIVVAAARNVTAAVLLIDGENEKKF